ncbi:sensor histidine kinase [Flavobacterium dankookense]|uniref:Two component regulator with propeller domain n=1 Tax=Flavobacterium dankookense TaxID=706186 RepID=A0A4R6QEF0_9FLAO|nr:ATP-binding protein [Flavobacterium dankookense]TDP60720.1 two component regulator with propeller domain [Flavobacterium dankookense]
MFFLFFFWNVSKGQNYSLANTFTVNEGLPSNHIYSITKDDKGFLWIATDNGISHFDGKCFYNYTVKDGLPSNDVLQVVKENDGTIWVNCYKQPPSYFDPINDRFVTITNNKDVDKISNLLLNIFILPKGGIQFYCTHGYVIFKNKKVTEVGNELCFGKVSINNKDYSIFSKGEVIDDNIVRENFLFKLNNKIVNSLSIIEKDNSDYRIIHNNSIYRFSSNNFFKRFYNFKPNSFSYSKDSLNLNEKIKWCTFSKTKLNIITNSGKIYMYDNKTLKLLTKIENIIPANVAFLDNKEDLWIGTTDKGLLYYNRSKIKQINYPNNIGQDNFLSITANSKGEIFAGNYLSQVFQFSKSKKQIISIPSENKTMWIRDLIISKDKIVAIHDEGYSINFKESRRIINPHNNFFLSLKSALKINDSLLALGTISGLHKLNINTCKIEPFESPKKRILQLAKKDTTHLYYIVNQSIFKLNYKNNKSKELPLKKLFVNNDPSVFTSGDYNLLWIATVKGDLVVLLNEKPLQVIKNEEGLPDNITNIITIKDKIWIASKSGIYVLQYKLVNTKLHYSINKLSKSDGLTSNVVNQLINYNDTIYAATNVGISIIPCDIEFKKFEIRPTIVALSIKNKKAPIAEVYDLNEDQTDISIQFAGVELSGHFKKLQYSLNSRTNWRSLEGNTLNTSLTDGTNRLYIRAIDANNNISTKILKLKFNVAFPFYKKFWFWMLISFSFAGLVFCIIYRRRLAKQRTIFEQQLALEQQRNRITADFHDEIGSTLSSLQINSVVANKLIEKNPKEAQKLLEKIELQSENIADKIGDIIWSMKPGKEEFMTISTRIKNFANDILGATLINYKIQINTQLDTLITDISTRKNIVLVTKEAINNAVKYSKATNVIIRLSIENNQILLKITDDGVGFDSTMIKGNGITNINKRITELNGKLEIISSPNNGATIKATIPIIP